MERQNLKNMVHGITIKRKQAQDRMVLHSEEGKAPYISAPILDGEDWIRHGFSTRLGGVSTGANSTMNLGFNHEPDPENVRENYRRMGAAIGFDAERTVLSQQTHTVNVRVVTEADAGKGYRIDRDYSDVDGLVTNVPGLTLTTFYADCVPLLIVDPVHRAIGSSHSGWRGTVADMGGVTLRLMAETYGTNPKDVKCAIGPSICQDCYEVSEDVVERFKEAYDESIWPKLFYGKEDGHYQLNLWEACRQNFLRAGVPEENIAIPDICTCCNPDLLFSHRAVNQGKHGNLAAFLEIR